MSTHLANVFNRFRELEVVERSPLYAVLSSSIAEDPEMLAFIDRHVRNGQPPPNMIFASTQYTLRICRDAPLAEFYPWLTAEPQPASEAYPAFREFVFSHQESIAELLETQRVQTNEVRRCTHLLPTFLSVAEAFPGRPWALIEIGCSAGLNLLWDHYGYDYGGVKSWGDPSAPVQLSSVFRGDPPAVLNAPKPEIQSRVGLDLSVLHADAEATRNWLLALVWPESLERRTRLQGALEFAATQSLDIREGNGFIDAIEIAESLPEETLPLIFHTFVANQISREARQAFLARVEQLGARRDCAHIHNNIKAGLHRDLFRAGSADYRQVARAHPHGEWIEWLDA